MIFKVNYNSALLSNVKSNIYVSFCARKLNFSRLEMHNFLYKHLSERKIINFPEHMFSFEVTNTSYASQAVIKCYVSSDRKKWYCKLEQLCKPVSATFPPLSEDIALLRKQIFATLTQRAAEEIRNQIDAEILQDLDNAARGHQDNVVREEYLLGQQQAYYDNIINPIHRNLDYQGIARRALVVEPLPAGANVNYAANYVVNPAANLDAALDAPIQVDPIDE